MVLVPMPHPSALPASSIEATTMPMEQINNNGYQMFLDTDSVFAPREQGLERQAKQNALARQQAVRNALAQSINPKTGLTNYEFAQQIGGVDIAPELQAAQQADMMAQTELRGKRATALKAETDAAKTDNDLLLSQLQTMGGLIGAAVDEPTYQLNVRKAASMGYDVSELPANFDANYVANLQKRTLTAQQQLERSSPKLEMANLGGTQQPYNPYTGKPVGSGMKVSLSPAEKARLDAETQTGAFSEDSIDLMAGLVAQGYQLPITLGRGSKSDALKNTIMERAGRIAQGLPPRPTAPAGTKPGAAPAAPAVPAASAVDVAATIGGARQDQQSVAGSMRYYSSGRGNQIITSLNTAVDHLDTLSELSTALGNGDVKTFNRIGQAYKKEFGQDAPTNLDAAKVIIAREVLKAITATGGGVVEAQELQSTMDRANSFEQLAGTVKTLQKLLAGQLDSIGTQYKATTRRDDFDERLSDRTKRVLGRGNGVSDVAKVKTDADYAKLPSGTLFVGPDGKQRRKP